MAVPASLDQWYSFDALVEIAVEKPEEADHVARILAAVPGTRRVTLNTTRVYQEETDGEG